MIDFRYHLVSLISVFLALAVGIILGAGPLQGAIGDQLTEQVETLRNERNQLRDSLDGAQRNADKRLEFIEAAGPSLMQGTLEGLRVAVVELDETAGDQRQAVVDGVEAAGGTVVGAATLLPAWTNDDHAGSRDTIASGMRSLFPDAMTGLPDDASTDEVLASALGAALSAHVTTTTRSDDAKALEQQLVQAGLISVDGDQAQPADIVVLLAGKHDPKSGDGADSASPAPDQNTVSTFVTLARTLQKSAPTVIVGPTVTNGDVVSAARGDNAAARVVSTVSGVETPVGRIVVPLALAAQWVGQVGQYGFEDNAAVLPPDVRGQWTVATPEADGSPDAEGGTDTNGDGAPADGTEPPADGGNG